MFVTLDQPLLIEVSGDDAGKILHNLTTNQVLSLSVGASVETFVTDVRGWVVAHGMLFRREESRWWLVGQHPDSEKVASHIDRYIIREDALVANHSNSSRLCVASSAHQLAVAAGGTLIPLPAFGSSAVLSVNIDPQMNSSVQATEIDAQWELARIQRFWPKMQQDIWDKCIPQELDRTRQAISFTKGCYLGQETIARLDALGQIQKKLSLIRLAGSAPLAGSSVLSGGAPVGHITSSVNDQNGCLALAVLRRGFFQAETSVTCDGAEGFVTSALKIDSSAR